MGTALLAVGIELLIGIILGLIITIIGLFFGNIIVFDSIALAVLAVFRSHGLLQIHPALAIVIGIVTLLGFSGKDMVWTYVVLALGTIVVFALHLRARSRMAY